MVSTDAVPRFWKGCSCGLRRWRLRILGLLSSRSNFKCVEFENEMKKSYLLRAVGGALGASILSVVGGVSAQASEGILDRLENYQGTPSMNQVNSVTEFSDVSPRHWAYNALRSLVERYDCIEGFPDGTFRGNRTLTRFEFAAGLNSCLRAIEQIAGTRVPSEAPDEVTRDDLRRIFALIEEFQGELTALSGRIDGLEGRVDTIEAQQFSTTTKLNGEAIFQLDSAFGGDPVLGVGFPFDGDPIDLPPGVVAPASGTPGSFSVDEQTTVANRVRLNFDTSFTGKDRLRTRLQANNLQFFEERTGVAATSLNFFPIAPQDNTFAIGELSYSFPILNDRVTVIIAADGLLVDDVFNLVPTASFAYDSLNLTVAYNNLIYDVSNADGAGLGLNILLSDNIQLDLGYFLLDSLGNDPEFGIFNSSFSTGAHLNYDVSDRFSVSLAYLYNFFEEGVFFDVSGFVGTGNAQQPFGDVNTVSNNLGLQFNFAVSPKFGFGGYVGYAFASTRDGSDGSADLLTAQANVYFPDLGKEGDALVLAAAIAPTVVSADGTNSAGAPIFDDDEVADLFGSDGGLPIVIDLEYRYPFTDNITTTFGGIAVINPEGISDNDAVFIGTIRTVFSF